ncbi:EF-P 5-aminopentanol modification-associated protein YfmH [Oceanobacillus saliphilus]|uniref:EF-P 5-aminopentanol modification-associated protein YfmH n=1 Tax=Oceanobacillus saliphilus TaxID=2925834 RepID=UPI00201DD87B|nr:pitrilysin family protein [Oceanobacillus saliphilus]
MNKQTYKNINETIYSEKLANGLTVFLLPKPEMAKAYGIFSTNYGSIDQTFVPIGESEEINVPEGVAHFLEHKLFEKKDRDVFADFGKQGASPNAYTSFTKTAYLFSATTNIEQNVETLIDFVQEPYFSEQSVEKEKGIISQEIKMYDDQPDWQSFMGTIKSMFKNHPVKIDIAGTVESITSITKDDLYTCYHTFYHPENMSLFVAGNFDPETMMDMITSNQQKKSFKEMEELKRNFPKEPEDVAMKENKITMPVSIPKCTIGIKESSVELSKEAFLRKDLLGSMVISHFFSTGGEFYQELYKSNLIDDSFYFETNLEKNFGYSMIGSNTDNPDEFSKKVMEQLLSTNDIQLTEEVFSRMKKKKIGQLLRSMNSLEFIANKYTSYHSMGINLFEIIPEIQKLTVDDVNSFIKSWISENRLAVCTISAQ